MNLKLHGKDLSSNIVNGSSTRFEEQNLVTPTCDPSHYSLTKLSLSRNCVQNTSDDQPISKISSSAFEFGVGDDELQKESKRKMKGTKRKVCARGHWKPSEDSKLKELVSQFGPQNWNLIARHLVGRSGKSCRLRWFNQLDPRINKRAFTEEEGERLVSAHRVFGNKWAMIARLFPGRTDNAVKNHWHVIMARKLREQHHSSAGRDEMTVLPSAGPCSLDIGEGKESMSASNEDESAASTCTTDLSLTPPASDNGLAPRGDQWGQRREGKGNFGKWMDHQNQSHGHEVGHHRSSDSSDSAVFAAEMKTNPNYKISGLLFFDFLGVGASPN
ncbi:PREDICTED: myb protein-like [Tarenaya hassleriana]|uniref:myb protein-like n=1 Tax=Tarenaya hassleriana TaxID=28532 RepID=UPI00053C7C85|nr:PREDICTED: myb protein-like [Tarenaya hassleriana]